MKLVEVNLFLLAVCLKENCITMTSNAKKHEIDRKTRNQ